MDLVDEDPLPARSASRRRQRSADSAVAVLVVDAKSACAR